MKQALSIVGMTLLTACGGRAHPQSPPPTRLPSVPAIALSLTPLSGQKIGVLPTTLVVTDTVLASDSFFNSRSRVLAWTDSLIGVALTERGRDRKSTRLNSSHIQKSRMPSSA